MSACPLCGATCTLGQTKCPTCGADVPVPTIIQTPPEFPGIQNKNFFTKTPPYRVAKVMAIFTFFIPLVAPAAIFFGFKSLILESSFKGKFWGVFGMLIGSLCTLLVGAGLWFSLKSFISN